MNRKIHEKVANHIDTMLGIDAEIAVWDQSAQLPHSLREAYDSALITLLGKPFVLLFGNYPEEVTPSALEKHLEWIENNFGLRSIYAAETLERYNRKRLIERRIPFVVPGNQLYLPDLGIDLREHLKNARKQKSKLGPSAQAITLTYLLERLGVHPFTATDLSKEFGYAKMSMSRAIQDLEECGLLQITSEGRERRAAFKGTRREIWNRAREQMKSPVKKRIYLERDVLIEGHISGLSALSEQTQLAPPNRRVFAITDKQWKKIQSRPGVRIIPEASNDSAEVELEIWSYDPYRLSNGQFVDPLSLALSLANLNDERVEQAIEHILEEITW